VQALGAARAQSLLLGVARIVLAACELPIACCRCYYGKASNYLQKRPRCQVMYHFGTQDQSIPMSDVQKVQAADGADSFTNTRRITVSPVTRGRVQSRGRRARPDANARIFLAVNWPGRSREPAALEPKQSLSPK